MAVMPCESLMVITSPQIWWEQHEISIGVNCDRKIIYEMGSWPTLYQSDNIAVLNILIDWTTKRRQGYD